MKLVVISWPEFFEGETEYVTRLFDAGLKFFHLRKHNAGLMNLRRFIDHIPEKYRDRIILYDHFELMSEYRLKGIHFNRKTIGTYDRYRNLKCHKSFSAHSTDEILRYDGLFDYIFISPVFSSISKTGYQSSISPAEISNFLSSHKLVSGIIALGGIDSKNAEELLYTGVDGFAVLGTIWNVYFENADFRISLSGFRELKRLSERNRPCVLSVAGFDPSGGAGIMADTKTMEMCGVYGMAACTAITYQNESEFIGVKWISAGGIKDQIAVLAGKYQFSCVKIGMIESIDTLEAVIGILKEIDPGIRIVWDPVISSSTGFRVHKQISGERLLSVMRSIHLMTPNIPEIEFLLPDVSSINDFIIRNNLCSILLKGGHRDSDENYDELFTGNGYFRLSGKKANIWKKHGSGCVMSSAIASYLSLDEDLRTACLSAKKYMEEFLSSNQQALGYHNNND
ncbi:MAG: bifunctional hydroxymethylpyrimidine kinase/phosphomethylpyrimidine kinase [Bacteroidota bacterium]